MGEFSFALENAITAETNRVKTICQNVSIRHGLTQNVTFTPVHLTMLSEQASGKESWADLFVSSLEQLRAPRFIDQWVANDMEPTGLDGARGGARSGASG
jgi:hypothetical protein